MPIKYIVFILVFLSFSAYTQSPKDSVPSIYDQVITAPQDSINKYKALSVAAYRSGDLEAFKGYGELMLRIATANDLIEERISALVYLAIYHQQLDQYEQSLANYLEAEKLSESLAENSFSRILVQVNLGNLYNHIEDYEQVKKSMQKVIALAALQEDPDRFIISAYNSIGTANLNQGNYIEALSYMEKVKSLAEKMNENDKIIGALINIAECQRYLKRYDKAIGNAKKALERIDDKESVELIASANVIIGVSHYLSDRPAYALQNLKEARDIASQGNFLTIKMEAHDYLAKTYEAMDSIQNSLDEQKAYTETREKYLKTLSKAQRLKLEKETQDKTKIIEDQEQSISHLSKEKQVYVFAGIALLALLLLFTFIYWKHRKQLALEASQLKDNKALLENENIALKDKLKSLAITREQLKNTEPSRQVFQEKTTSLPSEDQKIYMKKILDYMEEEKPYLDHEVKQSDIAEKLDLSVHLFSEVLNTCFKKNFNNFINLYRVDRAKQLMRNPEYAHYKILAIGYEAGFPSKTSFNRVFKNFVGLTPTEYQKKYV